ncbi:hypothetical protein PRK78_001803 [Emydomyces testavorans]|uniref:Myb-like domain-containing protein n=1 Tax=Emydomyces testavorans TaxID=2070801 RepID=A0AAF0DEK8_9EURO|nr:hypothetical protein PRK78_001803 [Emydomyces testavorans]
MAKTSKKNDTPKGKSPSVLRNRAATRVSKQRPATRTIVRWNDELDKQLLLSIQSACNSAGVRIPWGNVAALMGEKITEGAIVQHLAKLRSRLEGEGIPVPPPLRRGGSGFAKRTMSSKTTTARGESPDDDDWNEAQIRFQPETIQATRIDSNGDAATGGKSTAILDFEAEDNEQGAGYSFALDERFLQFPGSSQASRVADNAATASTREAQETRAIVLRIAPERLEEVLMNRNRDDIEDVDVKEEIQESLEGNEAVNADHESRYGPANTTSLQSPALAMEMGAMVPQSLLQIGAQHFQIPSQWTESGLESFTGQGRFEENNSAYSQLSAGPSTQMSNHPLELYTPGYMSQPVQEPFTNMYLPNSTSGTVPILQNSSSGSSQDSQYSWVDTPFPNDGFQRFENGFDVGEFISPEYLRE